MKLILFASLIFGLVACSSVIPPQTLADPIGILGQQVQVEIGGGELQTTALGSGSLTSQFADLDTSSSPIALNLSQSLFKLGFDAETLLETASSLIPCNISITDIKIDVTLRDEVQSYTLPSFRLNKLLELEQDKSNLKKFMTVTEDAFIGIALKEADVAALQKIITSGGNNTAEIRVSVQATSVPDLAPGSILTLTFGTSEATVTF
ncbi:MAG: hypothetical protein KC422_03335 [Trueperaceae bacterium]|nr:hypothetical protein [Trueperaceae bacterium]